jgi:hypothetical protein
MLGVDTVRDCGEVVFTRRYTQRDIELRRMGNAAGRYAHRRMVMGAAEMHHVRILMTNLDEGVVGRHRGIVAVADRLRKTVELTALELTALELVSLTLQQVMRHIDDVRTVVRKN